MNLQLGYGGVLLLHNLGNSGGVADNPPVAGGVFYLGGDHRHGIAFTLVLFQSMPDGVGGHKGSIPADYQYIPTLVFFQKSASHHHCVAGSLLLGLVGVADIAQGVQIFFHLLGHKSGDGADFFHARFPDCLHHIPNHGLEENFRQDFGLFGFHPGALSCRKDNGAAIVFHILHSLKLKKKRIR